MPNFRFRALSHGGEVVSGLVAASSPAEVARRIKFLRLVPIDIIWAAIERGFRRWIDSVADFIVALVNRFASPRALKLVEIEADEFCLLAPEGRPDGWPASQRIRIVDGKIVDVVPEPVATTLRGSRIEITLKPDRFLFRPFELPGRATEFLDGIVRSQIDQLTPWKAAEVVFGWSKPSQAGTDRIIITVAATDRAFVAPYVQAAAGLGAQSIAVFTNAPEHRAEDDPIKVLEERAAAFSDVRKIRQALITILMATGAIAAVTVCGSRLVQINLDAQQAELDFRVSKFRAASGASNGGASSTLAAAQLTLEKRKHSTPPSVIIIEALSRILPDDTFVTELRIEDNKIQFEGATHDAPSLIRLIEQSGLFTQATFFAPTTRSPSEAVERFHIEANIQSRVASGS
jgi:general secretion pathway protein L